MLPNGIYEQIVNTKISHELAKLDPKTYDIGLENLDANDARRVLTIYISYVISQALQYIRDIYPSSKDAEALLAQIRLCNSIVEEIAQHTQEADFTPGWCLAPPWRTAKCSSEYLSIITERISTW